MTARNANITIRVAPCQRVFRLLPSQYEEFVKILDAPPSDNPRLRKLLSRTPGWQIRLGDAEAVYR